MASQPKSDLLSGSVNLQQLALIGLLSCLVKFTMADSSEPSEAKKRKADDEEPETQKRRKADEICCWPGGFVTWKAQRYCGRFAVPLVHVAMSLVADGKGLLACDEPRSVVAARFAKIYINNHDVNRMRMRDVLFKTVGLGKYISGAILVQETLNQCDPFDTPFPQVLNKRGIITGIRADRGLQPLIGGVANETWTVGLDGLDRGSQELFSKGARFATWRTEFKVDEIEGSPSNLMIDIAAHNFARFARICQENGLVPIVEIEIERQGSHSVEVASRVMQQILKVVCARMDNNGVMLEALLLRISMVTAGESSREKAGLRVVAQKTMEALDNTLPTEMPGVFFLPGGLNDEDAAVALSLMPDMTRHLTRQHTFSFSNRLQDTAIQTWRGKTRYTAMAQQKVITSAKVLSGCAKGSFVASW